jgi:hypothetical protein
MTPKIGNSDSDHPTFIVPRAVGMHRSFIL